MEELFLSNGAVFPPFLWTGKRCETSKLPRFTKSGQEPNGIKLSSHTPLINKLRATHGDLVAVSRIDIALNGAG
jgi:hypothetical protein